jgi:hypothetical protein
MSERPRQLFSVLQTSGHLRLASLRRRHLSIRCAALRPVLLKPKLHHSLRRNCRHNFQISEPRKTRLAAAQTAPNQNCGSRDMAHLAKKRGAQGYIGGTQPLPVKGVSHALRACRRLRDAVRPHSCFVLFALFLARIAAAKTSVHQSFAVTSVLPRVSAACGPFAASEVFASGVSALLVFGTGP